jgi:hypothetical protein
VLEKWVRHGYYAQSVHVFYFDGTNPMKLILILMCFTMLSCLGPTPYSDSVKHPPTDYRRIEVVHMSQMQRPHVILGECRGDPLFQDVMDLKKMAAKLGADAISTPEREVGGAILSYALKWK